MGKDKKKIVSYDTKTPDLTEYSKLHEAFDFFNQELFGGTLPGVFFTIQRRNKACGFFRPDSFKERKFDDKQELLPSSFTLHEIAMMPEVMHEETDRQILSTIVHEMTHLQQQENGKPSRKGYHNREWADLMLEVGLQPSTLGEHDCRNPDKKHGKNAVEGGETGQSVSHFIIAGGKFDKACRKLIDGGFEFGFHSVAAIKEKPKKSKYKFTCPECDLNAWAKDGSSLVCGVCRCDMEMEEKED